MALNGISRAQVPFEPMRRREVMPTATLRVTFWFSANATLRIPA
jgi:hypothetical protein